MLYESTRDSQQRQLRDLKTFISVGYDLKQLEHQRRVEAMYRPETRTWKSV